jgi:4-methyl-5(b-hydroxyethyl)-thiazole monophosphate biosynthesis
MNKKALIILAEGVEDIEAVTPVDVLTRAGVDVTIAGISGGPVKAAYGNILMTHISIDKISSLFDAIILPGGLPNAQKLAVHPKVVELVKKHFKAGKLVAAICASPGLVLAEAANILKGKKATGFPDFNDKLEAGGAIITDQPVTADGNIITGMGPGAALLFGLMLVEYLVDKKTADSFAKKWRISRA